MAKGKPKVDDSEKPPKPEKATPKAEKATPKAEKATPKAEKPLSKAEKADKTLSRAEKSLSRADKSILKAEKAPTKAEKPPKGTPTKAGISPKHTGASGEEDPGDTVARTESYDFLTQDPEWDTESVRNHKLIADGFNVCVVLVMEDSTDLTPMGEYLSYAIKSGIRKRFAVINGTDMPSTVKKFMTSTKLREAGKNDESYWNRMDVWAEAIKHLLIQMKEKIVAELAVGNKAREIQLTGARSKDMASLIPKIPHDPDEPESGIREPPPAPPPTTTTQVRGTAKSLIPSEDTFKSKKSVAVKASNINLLAPATSSNEKRSSKMKKRGEVMLPPMEEIDDAPPSGPQSYVLLQGFYDPAIIPELLKIGVPLDGIMLMTDVETKKRNFSVLDIEDCIPGTFRPHNVLPNYLKFSQNQAHLPREERDLVGQFWAGLADIYNKAPPDSPLLDCAFMNFEIPKTAGVLETADAKGLYAAQLLDEASKRIYEFTILTDWFRDYKSCAKVKQLQPLEVDSPGTMYEALMDLVPAESVTIPVIMECMLEQVIANVKRSNGELGQGDLSSSNSQINISELDKFGRPDWGTAVIQGGIVTLPRRTTDLVDKATSHLGPVFSPPLYIKSGDFASIRNCHLNEIVAAHIASTHISGDMRNVEAMLWQNAPELDKGLYMKLLGNLNHFMYYLPPDAIRFEDMFFILHLLMSAGVEVQLQKKSQEANKRKSLLKGEESEAAKEFADLVHSTTTDLFATQTRKSGEVSVPGTKLDTQHNYIAIDPAGGLQFLVAPSSENQLTIKPLGNTTRDKIKQAEMDKKEEEQLAQKKLEKTSSKSIGKRNSAEKKQRISLKLNEEEETSDLHSGEEAIAEPSDLTDNVSNGALIATKSFITDAAELAQSDEYDEEEAEEEMEVCEEDTTEEEEEVYYFGKDKNDPKPTEKANKFIACEEQWFKNLNDFSVFQSQLECSALLTISDSGALDLSNWVNKYLLSSGITQASGESYLVGPLKDWNFVEELVPVQMIQLLSEAAGSYLSMQRMYCPFYDTILLIFNNPTPVALKADSQFYYKLKTLPGLQHFLEYSINDTNVLNWLMGIDRTKGVEVIDTLSISTLMQIVPEEQWLLVPSIKYMLYKEHNKSNHGKSRKSSKKTKINLKVNEELGEADEQFGKLKKQGKLSESAITMKIGDGKKPKKSKRRSKVKDDASEMSIRPGYSKKPIDIKESKLQIDDQEYEASEVPSFHFNTQALRTQANAVEGNKSKTEMEDHAVPTHSSVQFNCYDLGKRIVVTASDIYHLFPMDGTVIQYEISTIEPEFRMMQLTLSKNGHQTFFYPYYIPHDMDLSNESYVVCPYFHMIHANGTRFAFQDLRESEAAPYVKASLRSRRASDVLFSFEKVLFGKGIDPYAHESPEDFVATLSPTQTAELSRPSEMEYEEAEGEGAEEKEVEKSASGKKNRKDKKGKKDNDKTKTSDTKSDKEKKKRSKSQKQISASLIEEEEEEETEFQATDPSDGPHALGSAEKDAEWVYSEGEASETEGDNPVKRRRSYFAPSWENAQILTYPMFHKLKITLPSGLLIQVDDVPGPPVTREVKQTYCAKGSAASRLENCRYYTTNGSVIKFMKNGTIQILTARGVTTNIRELAASGQITDDDMLDAFTSSHQVRIFNGEVYLPTGVTYGVNNGKKEPRPPIFVFTSGPLLNGEIFRRRQDGMMSLHRHDGTTITHYPDGTRFTTRMVVLKDPVPEFEDWVFIGLKYMVEHPNYTTVIFNTLSGNLHLRLPLGDWTRVFADGSIKVSATDDYVLDVDKFRAVLSYPPCSSGSPDIPNLTAVKLWHLRRGTSSGHLSSPSSSTQQIKSANLTDKPQSAEGEGYMEDNLQIPLPANGSSGSSGTKMKPSNKGRKKSRGGKLADKKLRHTKSNYKRPGESKKGLGVEGLDGETLEEEEIEMEEEEFEMNEDAGDDADVESMASSAKIDPEDERMFKKFEIRHFLQFTDDTLLCKSIDSWDNRFAVDIYGETVVDKSEEFLNLVDLHSPSVELIKSLSEHCQLPQKYLSGILRTTSSTEFDTAAKRISSLKQNYLDSCGKLPATKIFVVKRDMTGYEYIRQTEVDKITSRAKSCRESMVLVDPLPDREPRQYITVMESVNESDKPHGMWTSPYREPVFRPLSLASKNLQVSKVDDLRWFGYVLLAANGKRPRFIENPRTLFRQKLLFKKYPRKKHTAALKETPQGEQSVPRIPPDGEETIPYEDYISKDLHPEDGDDEHLENEDDVNLLKPTKKNKNKGKDKEKKDKSKLPDTKENEDNQDEKSEKTTKGQTLKQNSKKEKKRSVGLLNKSKPKTEDLDEHEMNEDKEGEETSKSAIKHVHNDIGKYPENLKDVEGIYGEGEGDTITIEPQRHADICTEKKAIVVRSFVEIPQIDEKLQKALMAASLSYAQTVKTQLETFNANRIIDPRSEEEKQNAKLVKQNLIEQNLSEMHLLEQKSGSGLRFNF